MVGGVCEEQVRLAREVAKAVEGVYDAKAGQGRAAKEGRNIADLALILAEARKTEREAVAALDTHRKEHGC